MKLLYCSYKQTFRADNEYYSNGSFPYFIPALSQFFEEMYLMVPVGDYLPKGVSRLDKAAQLRVIETKAYRNKYLRGMQSYCWSFANILKFRRWQEKADAVLIAIPSTIHYLAYLPMLNKPLVVLVAGDEQEVLKVSSSPLIKMEHFTGLVKLRELLQGHILRKANTIICRNLKFKEKIIQRYNLPESKINIITAGIDTNVFRPLNSKERAQIRQNVGLKNNTVIGFVAVGISHSKGADTLIKAFNLLRSKYPQAKLLLIGEDILGFKRDQSIVYCGIVKKEDLPAYYNAMDIFVFPSRSEGVPKVVMEASACGIPVISTNVGGIPELIKAEETGFLVNPEDVNKITSYCQTLLEDAGLRKGMGDKGRKYALEKFDYRELVKKAAGVIQGVAKENESD